MRPIKFARNACGHRCIRGLLASQRVGLSILKS